MRPSRSTVRPWWFAACLAACLTCIAPTARCGDELPEPSLELLDEAIGARVALLAGFPFPSKADRKELKALRRAQPFLDDFRAAEQAEDAAVDDTGDVDQFFDDDELEELRWLIQVAKWVRKSRTNEPDITHSMTAVRERLEGVAGIERQRLLAYREYISDPQRQLTIEKSTRKGDKLSDKAAALWGKNRPRSAGRFLSAVKAYRKQVPKAEELWREHWSENPLDVAFTQSTFGLAVSVGLVLHPRHASRFSITVTTTQALPELTMQVFLLDKAGVDAGLEDVEEHVAFEITELDLEEGVNEYGWTLPVPPDLPDGEYYPAFHIDPYDRIHETLGGLDDEGELVAEQNNVFVETSYSVTVDGSYADVSDLGVTDVVVESTAVGVDPFDGAPVFDLTATVILYGAALPPGTPVKIAAAVANSTTSQPSQILYGQVWDGSDYADRFVLPELQPLQPTEVPLLVKFPTLDPGDLDPETTPWTWVRAVIDPDLEIPETSPPASPSSQLSSERLELEPPEVVPPLCNESLAFQKSFGNGDMGGTVRMLSSFDITGHPAPVPTGWHDVDHGNAPFQTFDKRTQVGAVGLARADFDVKAFGKSLKILDFDALAERDPTIEYGYFGAELVFLPGAQATVLGKEIDLETVLYSVGPVDTDLLEEFTNKKGELVNGPPGLTFEDTDDDGVRDGFKYDIVKAIQDGQKGKKKDDKKKDDDVDCDELELQVDITTTFKACKQREETKWFFPGGFPVQVTGSITGVLGFDLVARAADEMTLEATPAALAEASVEAKSCLGKICVGAKGEVILVHDEFRAQAGAGMIVVQEEGNTDIHLASCYRAENDITAAKGRLYAYATFPVIKWCKNPLFIGPDYIPCGWEFKTKELDILNLPGFSAECVELAADSKAFCCVRVLVDGENADAPCTGAGDPSGQLCPSQCTP